MNRLTTTVRGHLAALFSILVWGTTYISSKLLLDGLTPVELLFTRFLIGYLILWLLAPRRLVLHVKKDEILFAVCGLTGICCYYLLENFALEYTTASNVGVIIAAAPFFTAMLSGLSGKRERQQPMFYIGFVVAMAGICFLSFGGEAVGIHFFGDFLGFLACIVWAVYSNVSKRLAVRAYPLIESTRRMFFYGIIFMFVPVLMTGYHPDITFLRNPEMFANLLFLGVIGCAICFLVWNYAVKAIGAVKTSIYIYLTPVVTVTTSVLVLKEKVTLMSFLGIVLTLTGLLLSEARVKKLEKITSHRESII